MVQAPIQLERLNEADRNEFIDLLRGVFENAPWIPERAYGLRPFDSVTGLHDALVSAMGDGSEAELTSFILGHPELGGKIARAGAMTAESRAEQGSLGLDRLSEAEFQRFQHLNGEYRARFGIPFIICVRRHTLHSILEEFERRLANSPNTERAAAIAEIGHIARLRLVGLVAGPGSPEADGRLTTHVLDTVAGKPAAGVRIALKELGGSAEALLQEAVTNADGRTDAPLLAGGLLRIGRYQIEFHVGAYFAERRVATSRPPFLDVVPIRFSIADPEAHYHVPLLASPWSYSTYRGS
jgi:2-oxo-4-hydroxy-4-carboxy-5-ureidoimidazoline decarboxylase